MGESTASGCSRGVGRGPAGRAGRPRVRRPSRAPFRGAGARRTESDMRERGWTRVQVVRLAVLCAILPALPTRGLAAGLSVQCHVNTLAPSDNQLSPWINVVNGGTTAVALSGLTVRYWYTADGSQAQAYTCDWTPRGCANVTSRFVKLSPATTTADTYLELGFTAGAGTLAAGQSTGDVQ